MEERQAKLRFSLFPKILLTMLTVALVPFGSYWYVHYEQSTKERTETIHEDMKQTADALVKEVDAWLDMNLRVVRQNATLPEIISMHPAQQLPVLTTIANTYEWLIGANAILPDGMSMARSDRLPPITLAERQWFQQVMSGQPFGKEVLVTRATGTPDLALAVPIYGSEKTVVGTLMRNVHLTDVSKAVANVEIGKTGFAILLNETGKAMAHGRPESSDEMGALARAMDRLCVSMQMAFVALQNKTAA
jgi:methyl-accepting chemotaxis protein